MRVHKLITEALEGFISRENQKWKFTSYPDIPNPDGQGWNRDDNQAIAYQLTEDTYIQSE